MSVMPKIYKGEFKNVDKNGEFIRNKPIVVRTFEDVIDPSTHIETCQRMIDLIADELTKGK